MDDHDDAQDALVSLGGLSPQEALTRRCQAIEGWVARLDVQVDGRRLVLDSRDQVRYDPAQLTVAMQEQPVKVAWWGALVAKLARIVSHFRQVLEETQATVAMDVRRGALRCPGKVTEASIREMVILDRRTRQARASLLEAEEKLAAAKAILEGLRHRKEMIYLDGLLQNTEMRSTNMTIRRQTLGGGGRDGR